MICLFLIGDSRDILCHIYLVIWPQIQSQYFISYIRLCGYELTIYLNISSIIKNNHLSLLQQLCRLCGNTIVLRLGYVTPKTVTDYSSTLYSVYKIDCETENPDVFLKLSVSFM